MVECLDTQYSLRITLRVRLRVFFTALFPTLSTWLLKSPHCAWKISSQVPTFRVYCLIAWGSLMSLLHKLHVGYYFSHISSLTWLQLKCHSQFVPKYYHSWDSVFFFSQMSHDDHMKPLPTASLYFQKAYIYPSAVMCWAPLCTLHSAWSWQHTLRNEDSPLGQGPCTLFYSPVCPTMEALNLCGILEDTFKVTRIW